jgi:ketosteroid isomerase-like protein
MRVCPKMLQEKVGYRFTHGQDGIACNSFNISLVESLSLHGLRDVQFRDCTVRFNVFRALEWVRPDRSAELRKWNKNHKELAATSELCDINSMTRSRTLLLITGLILASSATSFAQDKSDAATVRALELKWTESYRQRSIDILSSLLADEFVITVEDGNVYSKAGYISHTADAKVRVEVAEMSDLKVRIHGNTAIVTGAYHEKGVSEGKPYEYHDRLTDVWIKSAGKWQVVASHYSVPFKQ